MQPRGRLSGFAIAACAIVACGDNYDGALPPPDQVSSGPVSIELTSMTLTVGSLSIEGFLQIGVTDEIDDQHYYDPRGGDPAVDLVPITKAIATDGESIILEGGTKLRLKPCPVQDCAVLELDASAHAGAVQLQLALPRPGTEPLYGTGDAPVRANVAGTVRELSLRVDPGSVMPPVNESVMSSPQATTHARQRIP